MQIQLELIPDTGCHQRCQLCQQPLSRQKHANQKTKLYGLCFVCLAEYEAAAAWSVETFLKKTNRCHVIQKRNRHRDNRINRRNRRLLSSR